MVSPFAMISNRKKLVTKYVISLLFLDILFIILGKDSELLFLLTKFAEIKEYELV